MTTSKTDKRNDTFFRSPVGIARHPRTEIADTRFDEKGVFSVRLILAPEEIAEVDALMRGVYAQAFPDDRRDPKLPSKEDEGQRYLLGKSAFKPKVCDSERRPLNSVDHGQRVRLVGRLRTYKAPLLGGAAFYLHTVDRIDAPAFTLDAPPAADAGDGYPS